MTEKDDRIRCRYCGSNNFAGTTTCWQCNRSLLISQKADVPPSTPQVDAIRSWPDNPAASNFSSSGAVDYSIADKSAIAMGLLFPYVGYPLGIMFMMLDNQRKIQLGRALLLWSTIGTVILIVLSLMFAGALGALAGKAFTSSGSGNSSIQKMLNQDGE